MSNTQDLFYFDIEDYETIKTYCWHKSKYGYCETRDSTIRKLVKMHKLLLCCNDYNFEIDHINRNKLDNRKENLRIVDRTLNNLNQGVRNNNTSGVTGVNFIKSYNKWISQIQIRGERHFKYFDKFEDACEYRIFLNEKYNH